MSASPPNRSDANSSLRQRLATLGRTLGAREASHREALQEARERAARLRQVVADALEGFEQAATQAGAPHLKVELGTPRLDDKHVRAIEFDVRRGHHRAIVTVKSRGEVTLVGPFRIGKPEGPCLTFPWDAEAELQDALGRFLADFVEEAANP